MTIRTPVLLAPALLAIAVAAAWSPQAAAQPAAPEGDAIRVATFNASLNRRDGGQLMADLSTPDNAQARAVAEIIQRVDPDILLINEFDHDAEGQAAQLFIQNYLGQGQNGAAAWVPAAYAAWPVNTGVPSNLDLDRNAEVGGPNDALGFGFFPGQYGMLLLSKLPLADGARTFQNFLWRDMPEAMLPDDPATPEPRDYYSAEIQDVFPLSSKSHWDVPIDVDGQVLHILASHPTPPVFDGPEDRNGTRNHDEVRFWVDYITPDAGEYIYDDQGGRGGLEADAAFVILGDQNLDPFDGDGIREIGQTLLAHDRIQDPQPTSEGGPAAAMAQGGINERHQGDPALDTADFSEGEFGPGNMRVDYVLPSAGLEVVGSGIFWPTPDDPLAALLGEGDQLTSDHHLVWVDIRFE